MFVLEFANKNTGGAVSSSDRLRKAIERNRAKVSRQNARVVPGKSTTENSSLSERLARLKEKRAQVTAARVASPGARPVSRFSAAENRSDPTIASKIEILKARRQSLAAQQGTSAINTSASKSRFSFGKNSDTSTSSEARTTSKVVKKSPGLGEKIVEKNFSFFDRFFSTAIKALLAKTLRVSIWLLNLAFLGVVIFGDRGVVDYVSRHGNLVKKENRLQFLLKENDEIRFQIQRINTESTYQRQVIRDYLGYIAKDEYLIIFAENQGDGV